MDTKEKIELQNIKLECLRLAVSLSTSGVLGIISDSSAVEKNPKDIIKTASDFYAFVADIQ